jgi:hypothetical protein
MKMVGLFCFIFIGIIGKYLEGKFLEEMNERVGGV